MRAQRPSRFARSLLIAALLGLACPAALAQQAPSGTLSIENEFIRIRVTRGPAEMGRFAVDTTGGDPSRAADDEQILIYGSRAPWTSYTTVLVDGEPYLFGGRTLRRAGMNCPVGDIVLPPQVKDNRILAAVRIGDLQITQELGFARSPTTRVEDAAHIVYRVTNTGSEPHSVGLRIMLDTMLGANDGAPLRAADQAITTATQLAGDRIPDYWQAFDSLANPAVVSQGTLRAPGLSVPGRLQMVDWGTLADAPWDFPFPAGADFTRRGEEAQDTAAALYWDPAPLPSGESRTFATLYGVGGISLSPAELSLGLTAPAEVDYQHDEERPFSVVAYVENTGGFAAREAALTLSLSEGLAFAEGRPTVPLGLLEPGRTRQATWRLVPTGKVTGNLQIVATVTSENLEPNRVVREITVISPPQLALSIAAPVALSVTADNRHAPNPFLVQASVANRGGQTGRNLVLSLDLPDGLQLTDDLPATQVASRLDPGQNLSFAWRVRALGLPTGRLPLSVEATAGGAQPARAQHVVTVPRLTPEIRVYPADQTVPLATDYQPTLLPIAVKLVPARDFVAAHLSLSYDPAIIEPLYVSRGEAFVEAGRLLSPWSAGRQQLGVITDIGGQRTDAPALNLPEVNLFTIVFMVKQPGETLISLEPTSLLSADTGEVACRAVPGRVIVEPTEEIQ
jgi:hypothetical protein